VHYRISQVLVALRLTAAQRFLNRRFVTRVNHAYYIRIACQVEKGGDSESAQRLTTRYFLITVSQSIHIDKHVPSGAKASSKIRADQMEELKRPPEWRIQP
jgi:hypothetical protein